MATRYFHCQRVFIYIVIFFFIIFTRGSQMCENEASGFEKVRHITLNYDLLRSLYSLPEVENWSGKALLNNKATFVAVDEHFVKHNTSLVFGETLCSHIQRNENIYLFAQYLLRREYRQKEPIFLDYAIPSEVYLFHCTPKTNIESICENNFDWRRSGTARGTKYGHGISFTGNFSFATMFPRVWGEKNVIIARVLKGDVEIGSPLTSLPSRSCDTTSSSRVHNQVFVKYEDNEFYPEYIIHLKQPLFSALFNF